VPRRPSQQRVRRWARRRGIPSTAAATEVARRYLTTTARSRWLGALTGFVIAIAARVAWSGHPGWATNPFYLAIIGYLLGAIASELRVQMPPRDERRVASLRPRHLNDYLPRWLGAALVVSLLVALTFAGWLALNPEVAGGDGLVVHSAACHGGSFFKSIHAPTRMPYILSAGIIALLATVGAVTVAYVAARRPQWNQEPDLVAADETIREVSASNAARAALGLVLCTISVELGEVLIRWDIPCQSRAPTSAVRAAAIAAVVAAGVVWLVPGRNRNRAVADAVAP
jgi:hypothetical protein